MSWKNGFFVSTCVSGAAIRSFSSVAMRSLPNNGDSAPKDVDLAWYLWCGPLSPLVVLERRDAVLAEQRRQWAAPEIPCQIDVLRRSPGQHPRDDRLQG